MTQSKFLWKDVIIIFVITIVTYIVYVRGRVDLTVNLVWSSELDYLFPLFFSSPYLFYSNLTNIIKKSDDISKSKTVGLNLLMLKIRKCYILVAMILFLIFTNVLNLPIITPILLASYLIIELIDLILINEINTQ